MGQLKQNIRVAILAYEKLSFFEFGCALELFALERSELSNWYQTDVLALGKSSLPSIAGVSVQCLKQFARIRYVDYSWLDRY